MKQRIYTFFAQVQDVTLRLFIEQSGNRSLPGRSYYTGAHCGTYSRMHQ